MKKISCFSIEKGGKVYPYIKVNTDHEVLVGEEGRGRKLVTVPMPVSSNFDTEMEYSPVSVVRHIPTSHNDVVAALFIHDQSGYRGTWKLCRDMDGEELDPSEIGTVIARGWAADGTAGRMGGGPEYLVLVHPGQFIIHRSGRLYGEAEYLAVEVSADGVVKCYDAISTIEKNNAANAW